jgi:hypothetical protein
MIPFFTTSSTGATEDIAPVPKTVRTFDKDTIGDVSGAWPWQKE